MKPLSRGLLLAGLLGLLGLALLAPRLTTPFTGGPGSDLPAPVQAKINRAALALYRLYRVSATVRPLAPGDPFPVRAVLGDPAKAARPLGPRATLVMLGPASCAACDLALEAVVGRVSGLRAYRLVSQGQIVAREAGRVGIVNVYPLDASLEGAPFASRVSNALGALTDQAAFVLDAGGAVRYAQYAVPDAANLLTATMEVAASGATTLVGRQPPSAGEAWPDGQPGGGLGVHLYWDGRRDAELKAVEDAWLAAGSVLRVSTTGREAHARGAHVIRGAATPRAALPGRPCAVITRGGKVVGLVPGYRVYSNDRQGAFTAAPFFKAVSFALSNARRSR